MVETSQGDCATAFKWIPIISSDKPVQNGVLGTWKALPADGGYCLRVKAVDNVGNSTEEKINVTVDTHPPAPPVLSGRVERIEGKSGVHLSWTPNSEQDLAGYNVYSDSQKLTPSPITDTSFTHQIPGEGEYTYTVKAVDRAGWESEPSNGITLHVDAVPPDARITSPREGLVVSNLVDIKGTAYSADDFREYRIYIGEAYNPDNLILIRRSPIPTPFGTLAQWDTFGLTEIEYAIRLEAEDISGNVNAHSVTVRVDNTPPDAPMLLSAAAAGPTSPDVTITWQPNSEVDLAGYLLYRNHELVNAPAIVTGSLMPYLINKDKTGYMDKGLPDGTFTYFLVAMDEAGNISAESNSIDVEIDTHPPIVSIVFPEDGHEFDRMLMIMAECLDLDIEQVMFQYKKLTGAFWIDIGDPVITRPFIAYLDTNDLVYGSSYVLQASATDKKGLTNTSPQVMVAYMDVTPPAAPQGLQAHTSGQDVTLIWIPNGEEDLDGYNIYRVTGDSRVLINTMPAIENTIPGIEDHNLLDGEHRYEVTAFDQSKNESKPSTPIRVKIFAPLLAQPFTPTAARIIRVEGSNAGAGNLVSITIETDTNVRMYGPASADAKGNFFLDVNLTLGANRIYATATDTEGNKSRPSDPVLVVHDEPPAKPTELQASVNGYDVTLFWDKNTEEDLAGYNLYRDGTRLNIPLQVTSGSISVDYNYPCYCSHDGGLDPDDSIFWMYSEDCFGQYCPAWWDITLDPNNPPLISRIEITWYECSYIEGLCAGKDYTIQVWSGNTWLTLRKVTGNEESVNIFDISPPYRTDRVRITVTDITHPYTMCGEVRLYTEDLIPAESYIDANLPDGEYHYHVTAVDWYGFKSEPSDDAVALVGDTNRPEPPQGLTATFSGTGIFLSWLPAGEQDNDLAGYRIYRGAAPGGPYIRITESLVTETSYHDQEFVHGITYYYVVVSVDEVGNESATSNEASERFLDTLLPAPPVIFYPTISEKPIAMDTLKTQIAGWAEPSSIVKLFRDEALVGTIRALSETSICRSIDLNFDGYYEGAALSPDGMFLAYTYDYDYDSYNDLVIHNLITGEITSIDSRGFNPKWSPDNRSLAFLAYQLYIYDRNSHTIAPVTDDPDAFSWSPTWTSDGNKLAFVSDQEGSLDVWIKDLDKDSLTQVTFNEDVSYASISPDGAKIAYNGETGLYVVDLNGGYFTQVDTNQGQGDPWALRYSPPEWSPDSNSLAFVSYRNDNPDLFVVDTETWYIKQLTDTNSLEFMPCWSPEGTHILYGVSGDDTDSDSLDEIRISRVNDRGAQDGGKGILIGSMPAMYLTYFTWLPSGEIAVIPGYTPDFLYPTMDFLYPKGYFTFRDINLHPGENTFHATATDIAGNTSPASEEITLILSHTLFPDLEVLTHDIFMYPSMPIAGEEAIISVFVWNQGDSDAENVTAHIFIWDATGRLETALTETLPSIGPYSVEMLTFAWDTAGKTGENSVIVVLDPANSIPEASEENNYASNSFYVVEDEGVDLDTIIDSDQYHADEAVDIRIHIRNSYKERAALLDVRILDEGGVTVSVIETMDVPLPYGSHLDYRYVWNTGSIYAGTYGVKTTLRDENGLIAENLVPFAIVPTIDVASRIWTDKFHYGPNRDVIIGLEVKNNGLNYDIQSLTALIWITDAQGNTPVCDQIGCSDPTVYQDYLSLLAGGSVRLSASWNTGLIAPGTYHAETEVLLDGNEVSTATASFTIDPQVTLTGGIYAQPPVVLLGNAVTAPYTITASGNTPAGEVLLRGVVMDAQTRQIVCSSDPNDEDNRLSLGMNETRSGQFVFQTAGYKLTHYQIVLYAERQEVQGVTKTIGSASFMVKDGTPPILTIVSPLTGSILDGAFDLTILATDNASGIKAVEYQVDGGSWLPIPASNPAIGRYTTSWESSEEDEGDHTISFRAMDLEGNVSIPVSTHITIMLISPFEKLYGILTASPDPVYMGEEEILTYTITNEVSKGISDLMVRVLVTDVVTGAPVMTLERTIDVPMNSTITGSFTFSTADMLPRRYNAVLWVSLADEPEPRSLATTSFTVQPSLDAAKLIADPINLLVWVNDKCRRKEEPDKERIRMRATDTEESAAVEDEEEYYLTFLEETGIEPPEELPLDDASGSDTDGSEETEDAGQTNIRYCYGSWNQCVRVDLLEQILATAASIYRIVYSRSDFEKEMRNPFYTDILILGDYQSLGYKEALELREMVNAGTGIVSSLWLKHFTICSSQCWKKANLFGVSWKGSLGRGIYTVTTVESPITEEGSFVAIGDAERVEPVEGAVVAGWMTKENPGYRKSKRYPAIVLNEYGLGRSVYCAFDLGLGLNEENNDQLENLITNAVSYVHRSREGSTFMPFRLVPLRLEFTSLFGGLDVRASETFPAEITLFDPAAGAWIEESPWSISLHLEPGETHAVTYYALTPDLPGTYTLETEAGLMVNDSFIGLTALTADIRVKTDAATLIRDNIKTLRSLAPNRTDKAMVQIIIRLLEGVQKRGNDTVRDIERNISDILISIDTLLLTKKVDTDPVRVMLDDLLRIEQGMYYCAP